MTPSKSFSTLFAISLEQGVNNLFEGDIELSPEQEKMVRQTGTLNKRTAGQIGVHSLWRDRLVPYKIAPVLSKLALCLNQLHLFTLV